MEQFHHFSSPLLFFRCRYVFVVVIIAIRVPLQRWRGARGRSLGRAVRRGGCPHPQWEGRQRGWLRARAVPGAGTNRHRLTGPCLAVASKNATLGQLPAFGGWSFDRYFQVLALRPWAGIEPATTPFGGLYQTELPVVASRESNPARPLARRHHDLAVTQRLRCAACKESTRP